MQVCLLAVGGLRRQRVLLGARRELYVRRWVRWKAMRMLIYGVDELSLSRRATELQQDGMLSVWIRGVRVAGAQRGSVRSFARDFRIRAMSHGYSGRRHTGDVCTSFVLTRHVLVGGDHYRLPSKSHADVHRRVSIADARSLARFALHAALE